MKIRAKMALVYFHWQSISGHIRHSIKPVNDGQDAERINILASPDERLPTHMIIRPNSLNIHWQPFFVVLPVFVLRKFHSFS